MMYGIITETAYTPCACKDQCEVPEACIELKNSVVKSRWLGKAQSLSDGLVYPAESVSYVGVSAEPHPIPILAPSYFVCGSTSSCHSTIPSSSFSKVSDLPLLNPIFFSVKQNASSVFHSTSKRHHHHQILSQIATLSLTLSSSLSDSKHNRRPSTPQHRRVPSNLHIVSKLTCYTLFVFLLD